MNSEVTIIIISTGLLLVLVIMLRSRKRSKRNESFSMAGMSLDEKIRSNLLRGDTIEAIRLYREASGAGLKEAKDYIDHFVAGMRDVPEPAVTESAGIDNHTYELITMNVMKNDIINAVRIYREMTGCGLKEAKDFVDELSEKMKR